MAPCTSQSEIRDIPAAQVMSQAGSSNNKHDVEACTPDQVSHCGGQMRRYVNVSQVI